MHVYIYVCETYRFCFCLALLWDNIMDDVPGHFIIDAVLATILGSLNQLIYFFLKRPVIFVLSWRVYYGDFNVIYNSFAMEVAGRVQCQQKATVI